jgi:starvation-inducible outer membrane lipoprotein
MKTTGLTLVAVAALGLSACAASPQAAPRAQAQSGQASNVDIYRKAVNQNAERKGVIVQWVNPPTAKDLDERQFDEENH